MDLSIIIVSFNTKEILKDCLKSVFKFTKGIDFEVIVVDNDSRDGSSTAARKLGARVIENKQNLGFGKANNQGVKISKGKYILFLNSDTIIHDNVLGGMVHWLEAHPEVGVATSALKNKDGSAQATGGHFPSLMRVFSWMMIQDLPFVDSFVKPYHPGRAFYNKEKEMDWVTGAYLLTRKDILNKVGGWDENFFMYVEEVDLCFRIKALGYKVWYLPKWKITHLGGASSKTNEFSIISEFEGIKKFYKKHYPSWQYPIVRIFLKIGALIRILVFGKTYAKAFKIA